MTEITEKPDDRTPDLHLVEKADPQPAMTPADRKRNVIIGASVLVAIVLIVVAMGIINLTMHQRHPASAILEIIDRDASFETITRHAAEAADPAVIARAVTFDRDPLNEVPLNVHALPWYQQDPTTASQRLELMTLIIPIADEPFIEITVSAHDPATSATLANALARAYERHALHELTRAQQEQISARQQDAAALEQQIAETGLELRDALAKCTPALKDAALETIQAHNATIRNLTDNQSRTAEELTTLTSANEAGVLNMTKAARERLDADTDYTELVEKRDAMYMALRIAQADDSDAQTELVNQLEDAISAVRDYEASATADLIPNAQAALDAIAQQIADVQAKLTATQAELLDIENAQLLAGTLQTRALELQTQLDTLNAETHALRVEELSSPVRLHTPAPMPD